WNKPYGKYGILDNKQHIWEVQEYANFCIKRTESGWNQYEIDTN
ncbi:8456_t:CDS:1, partial [Entrophospora sp. SA101]